MPFDEKKRLVELAGGAWAEVDVLRIVEKVQEYDPNLKIQYCAGRPGLTEAPYRLMELCRDGIWRVVFDIWELDERVLERVKSADMTQHDILARLDSNNDQVRSRDQRRFREEVLGEAKDTTTSILRSPKGSYTIPGPEPGLVAKFHDDRPTQILDPKTGREFARAPE